jgi:tetratricopeptide (TPR) repeat protein
MTTMPTEMDCETIENEGVALDYAAGRLGEAASDAFEAHYLGCARCATRVALAQALSDAVQPARGERSRLGSGPASHQWLRAAALLVAAITGTWFLANRQWGFGGGGAMEVTPSPARTTPDTGPSPSNTEVTWTRASAFEMPRYSPPLMRSGDRSRSTAMARAMEPYLRGDWATARTALRALPPSRDDAAPSFFLGAIELRLGDFEAAIQHFAAVVRRGDTPYREEALWYSAKARFALGDAEGGRKDLNEVVREDGDLLEQARALLKDTESLPARRPAPSR